MEKWKDIPGFEGLYQVSDCGRVRSIDRVTTNKNGRKSLYRGKILKQITDNSALDYYVVNLSKNGKQTKMKVHRLVAMAFLPKPSGMDLVDHIDCDPHNNKVSNLRWCTYQMNIRNANSNGRWPKKWRRVRRSDGVEFESAAAASYALGYHSKSPVMDHIHGRLQHCKGYTFEVIE